MKYINCRKFGSSVCIFDFVGKYGDWLFKQPLILALEKEGFKINVSLNNLYPPLIKKYNKFLHFEWVLVFTRNDVRIVDPEFAKFYKNIIEIQRIDRFTEIVKVWRKGHPIIVKKFKSSHEQERVRYIANYLCLTYQERFINIYKPKNYTFVINMNVGENEENRLNFNFKNINMIIKKLRKQGCRFKVLKNSLQTNNIDLDLFYSQFKNNELLKTKNFEEACHIIDGCDFYFGVDSGLSHYAVQSGKITFTLYSLKYHGKKPLFQSTFRNHLCYFGDSLSLNKILLDFKQIKKNEADKKILNQINYFLKNGKGVNSDPYSNKRKIFALNIALISQNQYYKKIALNIYKSSANIFFIDEILELNINDVKPYSGKIFINSKECVQKISKLISSHPDAKKISFYAKPCSFFYSTAMRDGSSDIDVPTLYFDRTVRNKNILLKKIEIILKKYRFSLDSPHQTPVISTKIQSLYPVIKNGKSVYSQYVQNDEYNIKKYEARLKLKIILGEIKQAERHNLEILLYKTKNGARLLKELKYLEQDKRYFKEWGIFIRKIIKAISILGNFGVKGHLFLNIKRKDCEKIAVYMNGLMRHGVIYINDTRFYPLWSMRRPQHGWFQPITIFPENQQIFQKQVKNGFKNPTCSFVNFLELLSKNKLTNGKIVSLLKSQEPLILLEVYRYIAFNNIKFTDKKLFSKKEIKNYARQKQSNCDNPTDRKLSLFSLASATQLPISSENARYLSKYNCFVQFFTSGGNLDLNKTKFFDIEENKNISSKNFVKPFIEKIIKLLREYYLYTLADGLPKEFLYEKRKEILFVYFVQGKALLEGPKRQSQEAEKFIRDIDIIKILSSGRILREIINYYPVSIDLISTEFLLSWLIRQKKSKKVFFQKKDNYVDSIILPLSKPFFYTINNDEY